MEENKKTVLVIEDQSDIAATLQNKLSAGGFNVNIAYDGEEGLRMALENHPDALLLDLILPKLDGMSILENIRKDEWGKNLPVIILSNLGTGDELTRAKELGVSEFLIKTEVRLEDVVSKLNLIFTH